MSIVSELTSNKYINQCSANCYIIQKDFNGVREYFGTYPTLADARQMRNYLLDHDWVLPKELDDKRKIREYYKYISVTHNRYHYRFRYKSKIYYTGDVIEEVLYARDLFLQELPFQCHSICLIFAYGKHLFLPDPTINLKENDLQSDNPYLEYGLSYPLPDTLKLKPMPGKYGTGNITRKSDECYALEYSRDGKKHYACSCRTYEQAYYVKKELNKVDWDMSKLDGIMDEYPRWYTWLLFFYQYVVPIREQWAVNVPKEYVPEGITGFQYGRYSNIEDALYERDFLMEHDWDYDLLVECIDDAANPYYNMELPPYPERKIKKIAKRNYHEKELTEIINLIKEGYTSLIEISRVSGYIEMSIRNWLKLWNTNFTEFKQIVLAGEDPFNVLEKEELIFTPDLSVSKPCNFNGYVQKVTNKKSHYCVRKGDVYYGTYKDKELAKKIVKELEKCNWDKNELPRIQNKLGYRKQISKGYIYHTCKDDWVIRKTVNGKKVYFGTYHDYDYAVVIRDLLINYNWNKDNLKAIRLFAGSIYPLIRNYRGSMFACSS